VASFELVEASFWDPERKFGELAPLTDDMVASAERALGVFLPAELLRLLRRQNGGVVADAWDACPAGPNSWARDHVPLETLFGIGPTRFPGPITLLHTPYLVREWDLPDAVVLLSGQGHYWIALDYRLCDPNGSPAVTWIDNEMGEEQTIAPDFHAFVERLTSSNRFTSD
jgi:hypothetical protein